MWAPGAYKSQGRVTLPAPNIGIEKYFFDVSETILSHIKYSRNTVILPQRTGPIADVLYSAAGNSADDQYYRKGIIAYSFEAGAQRMSVNPTTGAITRTTSASSRASAAPAPRRQGTTCGTVDAPNPLMVNEGHDSTMEFADGNYGLLQGALEYSKDVTAPDVDIEYSAAQTAGDPINYRFNWVDEASVIYYTTDGSTPTTTTRRRYETQPGRPRRPGQVLTLSALGAHTIKWMAVGHQGQRLAGQDASGCWSRPTTPRARSAARCRRRSRSRSARRRRSARSRRASPRDYTASTTANVISTAGDATLAVADPSSTNTGQLVNGAFFLPQKLQASATSIGGTGGARPRSAARPPDDAADLRRTGQQRRGDRELQADDRRQRRAAHGRLQQDADVHAVHDDPVVTT